MKSRSDSSGISFTALYTGAVWCRHGLADESLATTQGRLLYALMTPLEAASQRITGGNIRTFLLQRHRIIDHLADQAIAAEGITQVLEIGCGLSPRGLRLRQRHPQLHMVEADLPDMAARKASRLMATGHLGPHHQVTPIDILAESGDQTLEAVVARVFEPARPVIIITEGLTSYFPLPVIERFWRRLGAVMAERAGSLYLSETYLIPPQPLLRASLNACARVLGRMTSSQVSFHFESGEAAETHLLRQGFQQVTAHNPEHFYGRLAIPQSRETPLIRILAASGPTGLPPADRV
ncbi:class I SAM-dependent methyltransferase [Marinobacter caseinilyticus]|uniref:class I SAM-dependent methyltransferase n=1 Tax=Marinobacter caseinilyticus TaxID=2692195 RepID=UPI00140BEC07|nr:class I SAM-dependent methyltransferase [Marinobacter caseinilyticus]